MVLVGQLIIISGLARWGLSYGLTIRKSLLLEEIISSFVTDV
jgi:hypothetical protein